jgi:hypothetical protein
MHTKYSYEAPLDEVTIAWSIDLLGKLCENAFNKIIFLDEETFKLTQKLFKRAINIFGIPKNERSFDKNGSLDPSLVKCLEILCQNPIIGQKGRPLINAAEMAMLQYELAFNYFFVYGFKL